VLHGVHTALVTPFKASGELDLDAHRRLCERQLAAGIHGLVVCGTTGETPTLTRDEWETLVRATVELAAGRVPVTAGCGTNSTASTVGLCGRARELGADAALVVLPYYNKPNPAGHLAHMAAAASVGLPVVAYHVPGRTGQRVPVALLAQLASLDGVVAVKEATGDVTYGSDLIGRIDRPVLSGDDFSFFPLMCVGGAGVISVVSNVDPLSTVALAEAARDGDLASGAQLHHFMQPLIRWLFSDTNPVPTKAALAQMGLCGATARLPLASMDPAVVPEELLEGIEP
jgi:4-hydroxy-tetrahydrodipicolinate synthase